jgi:hypothetical protein
MEPRRFVVMHHGRERVVELKQGPFRLFANDDKDYYEGWVMPETKDPYGEPYLVFFVSEAIVDECE